MGSRRTAWRALSSIEQKEKSKGNKNINLLQNYKNKIEGELNLYCREILSLIDTKIISNCNNSESKVFFFKMQGDYQRYISEYA